MGGRFIILMVGAVLFGSSYLFFSGKRTSMEAQDHQNDYVFQGIAREALESGFDRARSAIKRNLLDQDSTFARSTMDDGYYDLSVTRNSYGDLDVTVTSHGGAAQYDMKGKVIFAAPLPAAFMIDDDGIVVDGFGFYQISGVDRRMPTHGMGSGFNEPVRGVVSTETHLAEFAGSLQADQVVGIGSQPEDPVNQGSYAGGFSKAAYEALYDEAKLKAHATLGADEFGKVSESSLISAVSASSDTNPQIIRATGHVSITGALDGYGMLLIEDGDLTVASNEFNWEGLIMIRKQFEDTLAINLTNTAIHGGIIAYDVDATGFNGSCPADFDIVDDVAVVNDSFTVDFTVLGAAISAGGAYDIPVTARINIGSQSYEPWGSYDLALDGNVNTGVTYSWGPTDVFPPGTAISVDARSWVRKDGTVTGNLESDWVVLMEENSSVAGSQIYLLEHNDPVPNVGGFMGQYSVVEFLDDYIVNDHLVLDADQAVSLLELGATNTESSAFDLQDLVILASINKAGSGVCNIQGANSMFDVDINNGTQIHYSSEAVAKLGQYLGFISDITDVRVVESSIQGRGAGETLDFETGIEEDDHEDADPNPEGGETMHGICHNGNPLSVPKSALPMHIAHGDNMGSCNSTMYLVCHNGKDKLIPEPALSAHLGHGDTLGSCPN